MTGPGPKINAQNLRKRGFSYSEIQKLVPVPKSTLSLWLRGVKMRPLMRKRLEEHRLSVIRDLAKRRKEERTERVRGIKNSAMRDIKEISKRELWLMGLMLYWAVGNHERDDRPSLGVRFSNSDPRLIKLFLEWLTTIGGITRKEIAFDIFIHRDKKRPIRDVITYWSKVTGSPSNYFSHVYFLRRSKKKSVRMDEKKNFGFLRIRVRASTSLLRQINGWIHGVCRHFWGVSEI